MLVAHPVLGMHGSLTRDRAEGDPKAPTFGPDASVYSTEEIRVVLGQDGQRGDESGLGHRAPRVLAIFRAGSVMALGK